jgi:hypothetical protein
MATGLVEELCKCKVSSLYSWQVTVSGQSEDKTQKLKQKIKNKKITLLFIHAIFFKKNCNETEYFFSLGKLALSMGSQEHKKLENCQQILQHFLMCRDHSRLV